MDLGPWSNDQINRVFEDCAPVNGYVEVWGDSDDALFTCYGSMLDNLTSDPTTILPQVASSDTSFIPAAALAAGLEGAFFTTDVDLNNVGSDDLTYEFLWLPRGADNSEPGPQRDLLARRGIGRPLRQRPRRGLRPRARPGRCAGDRGKRDRPARHEPDLQHSVGQGGRDLRPGAAGGPGRPDDHRPG